MNIQQFVSSVRDHYVRQFEMFVSKMSAECEKGAAEVKLLLGDATNIFERSYCADYVKNDDGALVVEMVPDQILTFDPMQGSIGEVAVNFDSMCWDDVTFDHDAPEDLHNALLAWFERWYDPSELQPSDGDSGRAHCLSIRDRSINVDFGTSSPDAFWELFNVLVESGAKTVRISTSRTVQT